MYSESIKPQGEPGEDETQLLEQHYVMNFKVNKCQDESHYASGEAGTRVLCPFHHSEQDKRRVPFCQDMVTLVYNKTLCPNGIKCSNPHCSNAHNVFEQSYHPTNISNTLKNQMQAKKLNTQTASLLGISGPSESLFFPQATLPGPTAPKMRSKAGKTGTTGGSKQRHQRIQGNSSDCGALQGHCGPHKEEKPDLAGTERNWSDKNYFLQNFKVHKCTISQPHEPKTCPMYHLSNDRRRNPFVDESCTELAYLSEKCPTEMSTSEKSSTEELCDDSCRYCHNHVEIMYHPERFRKKYCLNHGDGTNSKCPYGSFCSFAHDKSQIIIKEFLDTLPLDTEFFKYKYKTIWCPYSNEHAKSKCVYAHNIQDFRRDPLDYNYSSEPCPRWNPNGKTANYREGYCTMECPKAHNNKEQRFHPDYYKTKKCTNKASCKQDPCPFYHADSEKL